MRLLRLLLPIAPIALWAQDGADELFKRAMAAAREGRFADARALFAQGRRAAPADARFWVEGAGAAFRLERNGEAQRLLRRALRREPEAEYARNFLATLYLLDGNVEAALAVWAPLDKPRLSRVETPAGLRLDRVLLDRAVDFAPGETLRLPQWRTTQQRLEMLDVFSIARLDLRAADGAFAARVRAAERNGLGPTKLAAAAALARWLPFQAMRADYFNIGGGAANLRSLLRWDPRKRRGWLEYSRPLAHEPALRGRLFVDLRDEDWELRSTSTGDRFRMRTAAAGAGFENAVGGRLRWGGEAAWTYRDFGGPEAPNRRTAPGARGDVFLEWAAWRAPARRMRLDSRTRARLGRAWDADTGRYARLDQRARFEWIPVRKGDRWRVRAEAAGGAVGGRPPFDELYMLGVERDHPFWIRGTPGTHRGRKGAAPLGDRFWLANSELDRRIFRWAFLETRAGGFFDLGGATDTRGRLGAAETLLAAGLVVRLRVLGAVEATLLLGRDLRAGRTHFYAYSDPRR